MHVVYKMWIALVALVLIPVGCAEQHGVVQDASLPDSTVEPDAQAADAGLDAAGPVCTSPDDCQAIQVASGLFHSCALMRSGRVACWGSNRYGQLARDDLGRSSVPLTVEGVPPATTIMVGPSYSCALGLDHQLWCWGGELLEVSPAPSTDWLAAGSNAMAVDKFCYLAADGRVFCWGGAPGGRPVSSLGTGTTEPLAQPSIPVVGVTNAIELASGTSHACARTRRSVLWCWGDVGLSDPAMGFAMPVLTPVQILEGVQQITAAAGSTCALLAPTDLRCWGWNAHGQIGVGSTDEWVTLPTAVPLPVGAEVTRVAAGSGHACAVERDGHVLCWGRNTHGQLGASSGIDQSNVPIQVQDLDDAIFVSVATDYSCAVRASGEVWCWGATPSGQLSDRPVQVEGLR